MLPGAPVLRSLPGGADNLLNVKQVAAKLGICTRKVYQLCERGELPHIRISNALRFEPGDVAAFIAARRK
ncbi:MAG TPA: helix-turn-helix domain-containing protein [Myxococcales bacterium]|nr:helix-turn-helix domain-containing protein [Myxococcales bacterium]